MIKKLIVILALVFLFCNPVNATTFEWEHMSGVVSSTYCDWKYSYDIGFYDDTLMVDVDIKLNAYMPDTSLTDRWEAGIESIWSTDRFDVPISFNVDWVTTDYDYAVSVVDGARQWKMMVWATVGASGWGDAYQEEVAAHEFGHMITMWDEYAGGGTNAATNMIDTGGLMHTLNGSTLDYYYDPFLDWYDEKVAGIGSGFAAATVPEPAIGLLIGLSMFILLPIAKRKHERP